MHYSLETKKKFKSILLSVCFDENNLMGMPLSIDLDGQPLCAVLCLIVFQNSNFKNEEENVVYMML